MTESQVYEYMLDLFLQHRLTVVKVPGRHGGYVRIAVEQNADWYKRLCESHMRTRKRYRKSRTIIRRQHVVATLEKLASGITVRGVYAERIKSAHADLMEHVTRIIADSTKDAQTHAAELASLPAF